MKIYFALKIVADCKLCAGQPTTTRRVARGSRERQCKHILKKHLRCSLTGFSDFYEVLFIRSNPIENALQSMFRASRMCRISEYASRCSSKKIRQYSMSGLVVFDQFFKKSSLSPAQKKHRNFGQNFEFLSPPLGSMYD
jgi:hypothetical protein